MPYGVSPCRKRKKGLEGQSDVGTNRESRDIIPPEKMMAFGFQARSVIFVLQGRSSAKDAKSPEPT